MQQQKIEAFVLRRTDYGEADRILSVISNEGELLSVMARGVRKPKSKLAGGIEPLALNMMSIVKGKGDMYTLTSSKMMTYHDFIITDYPRLQLAYEIMKRIDNMAHMLSDPMFFTIIKVGLESLNLQEIDKRITEAWFWMQFAKIAGRELNLQRDVQGAKLEQDKKYQFDLAQMAFSQNERGIFEANHLKCLKLLELKTPAFVAGIGGISAVMDNCLGVARAVGE